MDYDLFKIWLYVLTFDEGVIVIALVYLFHERELVGKYKNAIKFFKEFYHGEGTGK